MWVISAAASATQFNLNCNVRTVAEDMVHAKPVSVPPDPKTIVFRIDLDRLRWCKDDCKSTLPIASANAGEIRLQDEESRGGVLVTTLDRESGHLLIIFTDNNRLIAVATSGQCDVAPFTGMPEPKF